MLENRYKSNPVVYIAKKIKLVNIYDYGVLIIDF